MTDYVSKKCIYDIIYKYQKDLKNMGAILMLDAIDKEIQKVPVIDVQSVRRGRWVECCNELDKKCSCCDKVHGTIYEREPFCPNCGARMEHSQKKMNVSR